MDKLEIEPLFDAYGDAVVVTDGDERVLYANTTAERLLAWTSSDLRGEPFGRLVPERLHTVDGLTFIRYALRRMAELDGRPLRVPALRSDGVEIDVDCKLAAAPTAHGGERLLIMMRRPHETVDFTQDQVERPIETSEAERVYRQVFDNAPLGIFHFDDKGALTACNDRFVDVIGSSKQQIVGLNMTTIPDKAIVRCIEQTISGQYAQYEDDYRSVTANKVTPVRVLFAPILGTDGEVTGGVGIVEDTTERKNAERALARADRITSLGTLAAGIAHEINNPLTYVLASIELTMRRLERGGMDAREVIDGLRSAREGVERVGAIVRDLGAFARSSDEKRRSIDVRRVLEAAIKLTANEIRHRATLVQDHGEVPAVWGVETRLVQVFVNLLTNAAQAISEGDAAKQSIRIATRTDPEGRVVVEVTDSGQGIAPEHFERIFEPFWTNKTEVGSGLGLSIVHGIVSAMGGRISVQSEVGRGTTFRVTLPASGRPPESARPAESTPRSPTSVTARILVVDDEERLARTMKMALQPPHDVEYVTSGEQALVRLEGDASYDLVLCDVMMPDVDGPELYARIRAKRPDLARRFVFMTGGAFTERTRQFMQAVDNPRLPKPFDMRTVEELIRRAVQTRAMPSD